MTPVPLVDLSGRIDAATFYEAAVASAQGTHEFDELASQWAMRFIGGDGDDAFSASDNNDFFNSSGGSDLFGGNFGFDRAVYTHAPGRIDVHLADGTVTKFAGPTGPDIVGVDTLRSIEFVTGTDFNDTFDATGFNKDSANAGSTVTSNVNGTNNEFEGRGGNDTITGNGATRVSYLHATAGVTVDLNAPTPGMPGSTGIAYGTAAGDLAGVGTDTFFGGVNGVRGSNFDDFLYGSDNSQPGSFQSFEGRGGDDTIDGRGGFDRAVYANEDAGIDVQLAAGIVTGGANTGTDTLRSIEAISGTEFADIYNATGFTASNAAMPSANSGNGGVVGPTGGLPSNFNEFEGRGGNDTITGNGNTRVAYYNALAGVTVMLGMSGSGTAFSTGSDVFGDVAGIGTDTFVSGVTRVRGSEFGDVITGNGGNNTLEGQGGNDIVNGVGGDDTLTGGTGSDIFGYALGAFNGNMPPTNNDTITDFNESEGDRIDLRGIAGVNTYADVLALVTGNPNVIQFDATHSLILNVPVSSLQASDFIFNGQVAITVQTPDGYNFGTLYDDMAGSIDNIQVVDGSHFTATNTARGLVFSITVVGATGGDPLTGTITAIDIYDSRGPHPRHVQRMEHSRLGPHRCTDGLCRLPGCERA